MPYFDYQSDRGAAAAFTLPARDHGRLHCRTRCGRDVDGSRASTSRSAQADTEQADLARELAQQPDAELDERATIYPQLGVSRHSSEPSLRR